MGDGIASATGTGGSAIGAATETGLITQFMVTSTPIPKPSSLALLRLGGLLLVGRRRI